MAVDLVLRRFATDEPHADLALTADVHRDDRSLRVRYDLRGDLARLSIPKPSPSPHRADGLWLDTCFELFLGEPGHAAYREVNLAPSGDWNVYRFTDYRQDGAPDSAVTTLPFAVASDATRLTLELLLPVAAKPLEIAVTAIVRDLAGAISHWALAHTGRRPDFHLRSSFVVRV